MGDTTLRVRLETVIGGMPGPVYAVVDGGHFDDAAGQLGTRGLLARSLFLGDAGRDVQRHGPWLVGLTRPDDPGRVLDLVGDRPAAVFWSCPAGTDILYDHLRRLNLVRVPAQVTPETPGEAASVSATETVLFRHWDPRVLSDVMASLDETRFARVLGPCDAAAYVDPPRNGGSGLRRLVRSPDLLIPPRGMLSLEAEQIAAVEVRVRERSRRKTAAYLTDVAPELAEPLSPVDLHGRVLHAEATGRALGIEGERAHLKWAYLMLVTDGQVAKTPLVTGAITSGGKPPDEAVDIIMRQVVRAARTRDGG